MQRERERIKDKNIWLLWLTMLNFITTCVDKLLFRVPKINKIV